MSDIYGEMADIASEILAEFKQGVVTLTRTIPGEPDPETPWIPGEPTTATYALDATVKGVSEKFIDGTTILATDLEVTCSAFAVDPLPSDALAIDGKAVTVVRTMRIPAAGTLVCWKFIVRG